MTRNEKIEALAREIIAKEYGSADYGPVGEVKLGILAGIKLRDEELLAMEFDEKLMGDKAVEWTHNVELCGFSEYEKGCHSYGFGNGARWQHEQFIKAIKGDG